MLTIKTPRTSLIQFTAPGFVPPEKCCHGAAESALPIFAEDDIAFQVQIETSTIAEATEVMEADISLIKLYLTDESGAADIYAFINLFTRHRTGLQEVTFRWGSPLDTLISNNLVAETQCFRLKVKINLDSPKFAAEVISSVFKRVPTACYTSVLQYLNQEDYDTMRYCNFGGADNYNRVRVWLYPTEAKTTTDKKIYRKSNGTIQKLSSLTTKEYKMLTDFMSEEQHDGIIAAFDQDAMEVTSDNYTGAMERSGDYSIDWQSNLCIAPAEFRAAAVAYTIKNSNCSECHDLNCPDLANINATATYQYGAGNQDISFTYNPISSLIAPTIRIEHRATGTANPWVATDVANSQPIHIILPLGSYDFRFSAIGPNCAPVVSPEVTGIGITTAPICAAPSDVTFSGIENDYVWADVAAPGGNAPNFEVEVYDAAMTQIGPITVTVSSFNPSPGAFLNIGFPYQQAGTYTLRLRADCGGGVFSSYADTQFIIP